MRKLSSNKAANEVAAIVLAAIIVLVLVSVFDISHAFAAWAQRNAGWGADGLLAALFVLVLGFGLLAWRRWRRAVQDLQAHQAAAESDKLQEVGYRTLFDEALNPIFVVDTEGRYRKLNAAALRFLECDEQELAHRDFSDFKIAGRELDTHQPNALLGVRCTVETEYRANGRTKTLMLNMVPMKVGTDTFLFGIGQDITTHRETQREQELLIRQLQDTVNHTKVLRGLLPICANCKRIRDERGYWHSVERYFSDRLDVRFTHGVCPECMRTLYGDLMKD